MMMRILHYFIIILVLSGNVLYQQVVQTLTHDTGQGAHPSIVQVSTNVFAVAYHGTSGKGIIKTFTIASNGSTITENQELQHDGSKAKYNSLIQVDSDTYLLAYEGGSNDGFIKTFTIPSALTSPSRMPPPTISKVILGQYSICGAKPLPPPSAPK